MILKKRGLFLGFLTIFLMGCQVKKTEFRYMGVPVDSLYGQGLAAMEKKNFSVAAEIFEEIDRQYPHTLYDHKSQFYAGYCFFRLQRYDSALRNFQLLMTLHPESNFLEKAYYFQALCHYKKAKAPGLSQDRTLLAIEALEDFLKRFPLGTYGEKAKFLLTQLRITLEKNQLDAVYGMIKRRQYIAALVLLSNLYQSVSMQSPLRPEILFRLIEVSVGLGLPKIFWERFFVALKQSADQNSAARIWLNPAKSLMSRALPICAVDSKTSKV